MEKNHIKVNDDLTLEMDGRMYRLTKNKLNNCGHCPFRKIQGCGELCRAAYYKAAETPSFDYYDAIFIEVTENKETTMEEKEPKNEPDYKALYEQEHKKYGDAVERMKSWMNGEHPECFSEAQKAAEFVFPELAESGDERIRKALLEHIKGITGWNYFLGISREQMIAWLEKQDEKFACGTFVNVDDVREEFMREVYRVLDADSTNDRANQIIDAFDSLPTTVIVKQDKQKHTGEVVPKFKDGDIIKHNRANIICKVISVNNGSYDVENIKQTRGRIELFNAEQNFHLWTIRDAKDGDILAWSDSNCIAIFSKIENDESFISHGFIGNITGVFEKGYGGHSITNHLHPATREQRDLLFTKMKEAGYEWDSEKKELRKIEQKSDWSEEDERTISGISMVLQSWDSYHVSSAGLPSLIPQYVSWLDSLKGRILRMNR